MCVCVFRWIWCSTWSWALPGTSALTQPLWRQRCRSRTTPRTLVQDLILRLKFPPWAVLDRCLVLFYPVHRVSGGRGDARAQTEEEKTLGLRKREQLLVVKFLWSVHLQSATFLCSESRGWGRGLGKCPRPRLWNGDTRSSSTVYQQLDNNPLCWQAA